MTKFLSHVLSLLVVFLLLAATAVWTGSLFGVSLNKENKNGSSASAEGNGIVLPKDVQKEVLGLSDNTLQWTERDSASWNVLASDGTSRGVVISSAPYARDVKGFAGNTPLYIYIGVGGKVEAVAAADNAETPWFFNRAFSALQTQWLHKSADEAQALTVDAVSGATFSSNAIIANVQRSLSAYNASSQTHIAAPTIGWLRTVAVALVLLLGIVATYRFRKVKWLRIVQLVLNVGILGFWCGQFLSLSLLRGWVANGLDPVAYLPTLLVLAVAVVLPFCKRPHHYCSWVCPFGSLQELAGRLPLPKIKVSARAYRVMSRVRFFVLVVLLFTLWMGMGAVVLDYEPFTAFFLTAAAPAVVVLATVFVVASMFVPNLWCKSLCPMGCLLSLSEK